MFNFLTNFWNSLDSETKVALIAGILPSLVSIAGFWFTSRDLKNKTQTLYSKYVDVLLEKRLESYQKLLQITYYVGLGSHYTNGTKEKYSDKEKIVIIQKTLKEMIEWEQTSGAFFLLSQESLDWFRHLENLLHAKPGITDKAYTRKQLDKIVRARNGLRTALSRDLYLYRDSENRLINKNSLISFITTKFRKLFDKSRKNF